MNSGMLRATYLILALASSAAALAKGTIVDSERWDEYRMHHRKDGRIVKVRDDLMVATRYAIMSLRYAETETEARDRWKPIEYDTRWIL